jgi:hypothetical protein
MLHLRNLSLRRREVWPARGAINSMGSESGLKILWMGITVAFWKEGMGQELLTYERRVDRKEKSDRETKVGYVMKTVGKEWMPKGWTY